MISDTIAAISTSMSTEGAISVIRISGKDAIGIIQKIFSNQSFQNAESHTIHYGHIINPDTNLTVDEVLVMLMKGPRSFTAEDVVEVNCHGGSFITGRILDLILENGARLATPGEFSKRAFLNGRIDLTEAESIMDLINANNEHAQALAMKGISGEVRKIIEDLRENLLNLIANIEVNIDYPEYDDVTMITDDILRPASIKIKAKIEHLIASSHKGKILKNGINTAIIGRPNVGKSSLLNLLMREEKAIVTDIPGTTRDTIEAAVNIGGLTLNLIDTAGIRETDDTVEQIGVEKSKAILTEADLILLILNGSEPLTDTDRWLMDEIKDKDHLVIVNKSDLPQKINLSEDFHSISTSFLNPESVLILEDAIKERFGLTTLQPGEMLISNARHVAKLKEAMLAIETSIEGLDLQMPIDMVEMDLKIAWEVLGEIIGENVSDSLIDELFTKFCLGK